MSDYDKEDESQAVVAYVVLALACVFSLFMFWMGRYTMQKDMKEQYHMNHCNLGQHWSVFWDGTSKSEREATENFVREGL